MSGPINTGHTGVVVKLTDKQLPTSEEIAQNFDATRDSLLDQRRGDLFNVVIADLHNNCHKEGRIRVTRGATQQPPTQGGSQG
jgi:peptidyl-prolyl cis-trans isomerase D